MRLQSIAFLLTIYLDIALCFHVPKQQQQQQQQQQLRSLLPPTRTSTRTRPFVKQYQKQPYMSFNNDNNNNNNPRNPQKDQIFEESRLKIWTSRRNTIRSTLQFAQGMRTLRIENQWIPEDPTSSTSNSTTSTTSTSAGKTAVSLTAFGIAAGAVLLRLGGRAALVSAVGLDFAKDNVELKQQLDSMMDYSHSMNLGWEVLLFTLAWICVKVFCFDAGGVVLALASGLLFGGVVAGAVASAAAATIGSSVCFILAQLDSPVRTKALEIVEEYPSLRGIEKVVATDGFKAILTLRLAPILPIPLGLYNYVYGVTNVPYVDFAAGIFLGSLKPYLLDSYLGFFGMSVVDGSVGDAMGYQDVILLFALGLSVLIGVFASQLAGETWEVVLKEVEVERQNKVARALEVEAERRVGSHDDDNDDSFIATMMDVLGVKSQIVDGLPLPEWVVDWQINWGLAEERMMTLINSELEAQVWNYTTATSSSSLGASPTLLPQSNDPALQSTAPELTEVGQGVDIGLSILEGMVLSPALFRTVLKVADPMYITNVDKEHIGAEEDEEEAKIIVQNSTNKTTKDKLELLLRPTFMTLVEERRRQQQQRTNGENQRTNRVASSSAWKNVEWLDNNDEWIELKDQDILSREILLDQVSFLRERVQRRLERLEKLQQQLKQKRDKEEKEVKRQP